MRTEDGVRHEAARVRAEWEARSQSGDHRSTFRRGTSTTWPVRWARRSGSLTLEIPSFVRQVKLRALNIRPATVEDLEFLEAMLWEAFFWSATAERPAFSAFRQHPEFTKLLSGWGRRGDWGAIAEDGGRPIRMVSSTLLLPSSVSPFLRLIDGRELVARS